MRRSSPGSSSRPVRDLTGFAAQHYIPAGRGKQQMIQLVVVGRIGNPSYAGTDCQSVLPKTATLPATAEIGSREASGGGDRWGRPSPGQQAGSLQVFVAV